MKIGIILGGNIWSSPFAKIYTDILDDLQIEYDLISWNRDGEDKRIGIQYNLRQNLTANKFEKFIAYIKFMRFVNKVINENKYDKIILLNTAYAIFNKSIIQKYKGKYIYDYRDLSIEQRPIFSARHDYVLANSYANVISSPGFEKVLPQGYRYIISHNFFIDTVKQALSSQSKITSNEQNHKIILTIGAIRDYESNSHLIKALANLPDYIISFVGKGISVEALKNYAKSINATNVEFTGYYEKKDEARYILQSNWMNIYYPRKLSHDTALSNRFYNSLIFKRPMIVTKDTIQGDYAEKYNVGVAISDCNGLKEKMEAFQAQDFGEYAKRCNALLEQFIQEQEFFISTINKFISK